MGSIHIAGTWRMTASADDVWAVVEDLETWPRWWPAIQDVTPLGDGQRARFTFDTPAPLRPLKLELTIVEHDAPNRLVARATDGPLTGDAVMQVTAGPQGSTAVVFDVQLRVRSLLFRPLESVLAGATRSGGRERLRQAGDDLSALAGGRPLEHDV